MSATAVRDRVARVDAGIGAVPMVRLVLVWLAVIAAAAVVGALLGGVSFPPLAILALLAVSVLVSWGSSRLAARIVGSPAHDESAVVTGLILGLILPPSLEPGALLTAALVALVATASKYGIRLGGRHVLNPAAAGLVLVGLTGLPVSYWWVGTPVLAPVVLLAAIVIAVRLRAVLPVAVLVVAGAAAVVGAAALAGFDPGQALRNVLLSSPLLFLAGTMLTEPITLPPRTRHRVAEALLIAVLLALPSVLPLHVGTLSATPELALLIGNLAVLAVARPVGRRLRFAGSRRLTPTAVEYAFTPDRPVRHAAGQYLELHLPHRGADGRGTRRSLTIVSPPDAADGTVKVAVRTRAPGSSFKRALDGLPEGAVVRAVTVTGGFTLPADRSVPLLLVAGGIGVTPFISQLQHDAALTSAGAPARDVLLVDRVPSADEVPYLDELAATGVRVLLICPDPDALPALPDHWHAAAAFDEATLRGVLPAPAARTAYVSGSARFIASARRVLRGVGVRRIRTDAFSGY